MKKLFSITLVMSLAFGIFAQDAQVSNDQAPNMNISKRDIQQSRLNEKLNLDDNQKQKLRAIREASREEMKARGSENREFRQNLRAKTEKEIQAILTPDQLVALQEMKAERQENSIKGKECHGGQNDGKAKSCSKGQGEGKGCCKKDGDHGKANGQGKGCCKKDGGQSQGCSHGGKTPNATVGTQTNSQPPANR